MSPDHPDRHEQRQLDPPIPHLDVGLIECALAKQRWLRMEQLEVAADRDALGEMPAVIELEHGNPAERVLFQKLRLAVDALEDIDFLERDADSFFREENAHAAWIGRKFV